MKSRGDVHKIDSIVDPRGELLALEVSEIFGFDVKRIYFLTKFYGDRGFHAHRNLYQVMICISGSCELVLDDGETRSSFELNNIHTCVYVGKMVWREIREATRDCTLLVLASECYDESDYIRNYDDFLKLKSVKSD